MYRMRTVDQPIHHDWSFWNGPITLMKSDFIPVKFQREIELNSQKQNVASQKRQLEKVLVSLESELSSPNQILQPTVGWKIWFQLRWPKVFYFLFTTILLLSFTASHSIALPI